jgi:hypothetical protein
MGNRATRQISYPGPAGAGTDVGNGRAKVGKLDPGKSKINDGLSSGPSVGGTA